MWWILLLACGGSGTSESPDPKIVLGYVEKQPPLKDPIALFEGQGQPGLPKLIDRLQVGMSEAEARVVLEEVREGRLDLMVFTPADRPELKQAGLDKMIGAPLAGWDRASVMLQLRGGAVVQIDLSLPPELEPSLRSAWAGGEATDDFHQWKDDQGRVIAQLGPAGDRALLVIPSDG